MTKLIGLLGGSFDPPHLGHLAVAEHAHETLNLDEVWLLITPQNPEKERKAVDFAHRFAMCQAMAENENWLKPSDFEQQIQSFETFNTLSKLLPKHPEHQFIWLMGADNLQTVHEWAGWDEVMAMLPVVIYQRPEFKNLLESAPFIEQYAMMKDNASALWKPKQWKLIEDFAHPASSTNVRHLVKSDGTPIDVPEEVASYIQLNKLYQ